jgi:hypothetical protein
MDETRQDIDTQDFGTNPGLGAQHDTGTRFEGRSSTDGVTMRFGPGVPPSLAGVWRDGGPRERAVSRRVAGGLVTLGIAVLTGLVVWFLLQSIRVPLRWTVRGPGRLHAIATLEVLSQKGPNGTASGAFEYACG